MASFSFLLVWTLALTVPGIVFAEESLPPAAKEAIDQYEAEIQALNKELELKRLQARARLDKSLLAQQIAAADQGKLDVAKQLESQRG